MNLSIEYLRSAYQSGELTPRLLINQLHQEFDKHQDNPIWIHRLTEQELEPYLSALESQDLETLPLYGIPFAIKDNIDLSGVQTTAACPAFAYTPTKHAHVVAELIAAGAIPMGKTNLDQFATGLVGVRSPEPWGPVKNALNPEYISGGSSSGSSVAVASGLVSFSLGTDTAGSGRVPASLNNIVGLKPSIGLLSCTGVVPACKSLDCVSIFATNIEDANTVFNSAVSFDAQDAYGRKNSYGNGVRYGIQSDKVMKVGVPASSDLAFFGNTESEALYGKALEALGDCEVVFVDIDLAPFLKAAALLYEGPWIAERYVATQELFDNTPEALLPVLQTIISGGKKGSAADVFKAQYRLNEYRQQALIELSKVDAVVMPTNGSHYTIQQLLDDPIQLNSNMGYYTNFVNLLDYSAISVPAGHHENGIGFGITLFHKALHDKQLMLLAKRLADKLALAPGAHLYEIDAERFDGEMSGAGKPVGVSPSTSIDVLVCGAHLEGLPLNWQLNERGATKILEGSTSDKYRFYALAGGPIKRPALVRDESKGAEIDVEVWRMPREDFGSFVAEIPAPLGIGKVELASGEWVSGFICDPWGLEGAQEITELGSWKAYLATL
ncbi:MAG: allophanate hydrolase [Agarilytica sp.]